MSSVQTPSSFILRYLVFDFPERLLAIIDIVIRNLQTLSVPLVNVIAILTEKPLSSWSVMAILPPIITVGIVYLCLYGFHRAINWAMKKAFLRWSFILALSVISLAYIATDSSCRGDITDVGLMSSLGGVFDCLSQPEFWEPRLEGAGAVVSQLHSREEGDRYVVQWYPAYIVSLIEPNVYQLLMANATRMVFLKSLSTTPVSVRFCHYLDEIHVHILESGPSLVVGFS
ncbi:hypothetical protein EIP86_010709 [Pleurotus ostreatoroseus]|nr:hypothetical protein EIP86_010709 [Pleurotus ostreatoroseus]